MNLVSLCGISPFIKALQLLLICCCGFTLAACSSSQSADQVSDAVKTAGYKAPLVPQRADPWIHRATDGRYYFIATSPEFDRIEMREANSVHELADAPAKVVWRKHAQGVMGAHIWAPELHRIDGIWYVYFAAGEAEKPWIICMFVLANPSPNPLEGEWQELGKIETLRDSFSLDATHFEHHGKRYLIWAQKDPEEKLNSALYIAQMKSPTELHEQEMLLTQPELPWEIVGYKVNEGAAVLVRNGKVFVTYSASATDHNYAMGLLWADADADLLDPASWNKLPEPVFFTNESLNRFGPGHNSFTLAEDGKTDLMIYHARDYRDLQGTPLTDPNRHTYVRKLLWDKNGMPDFAQSLSDAETFKR
jgi:GH43 family beta-xylosidase